LFYEELEYAKMISFQFIKSGLAHKKDCSYLSEEEVDVVKRDMADIGINVNGFTKDRLLHIHQIPSLTDYDDTDSRMEKEGFEHAALNSSTLGQTDRIVLRCVYKITSEEQRKSNLKWEYDYHTNLKNSRTTIICTYPIKDILPTISDSSGSYGKWMNDLLEIYDAVIFARRFWKGVAFNLN
jgi:hypothetical protein